MAVADVLTHVRRLVQDEPWADFLTAGYTLAATTVTVNQPTAWEEGDIMDFPGESSGGSYEQMRVKATPSANPVSITFAWNDTTNQAHSDTQVVLKSPRYGTDQIVKAITHVVDNWLYPDIFAVTTATITPTPTTTNLYDLLAAFEEPIAMWQLATGSIEDLVPVRYSVITTTPSSISATNKVLRVTTWPRTDVDATLFYKTKATTTTMTAAMEPIIGFGTAAWLLKTESQEKVDRLDEDDRTGRMVRTAREMERLFFDERRRLRSQLLVQYGTPKRRFRR